MYLLWKCLALLCAATYCLQSNDSSDTLSLECNKSVLVFSRGSANLSCTVHYGHLKECNIEKYELTWGSTGRTTSYYFNHTNVLLNISGVTEEDTCTVGVYTDCGMIQSSSPVEVKVPLVSDSSVHPGTVHKNCSEMSKITSSANLPITINGADHLPKILIILGVFIF